jgi:hypothetical protein
MDKPNAAAYFRGKENYNCAQALLKAYEAAAGIDKSCLDRFANFGGGRAPDGECGALFAAKSLLQGDDVKKKLELEDEFVLAAGSRKCRDIRKTGKLTCAQCVQKASDIVFSQWEAGHRLQLPPNWMAPAGK